MKVLLNSIILFKAKEKKHRVIHLDSISDICITFTLEERGININFFCLKDIYTFIQKKEIEIINDVLKAFREDDLSEAEKIKRDNAYNIVQSIYCIPSIFYSNERAELVKKACIDFGISKKTVYKYLKLYWENGMNINSLIPNYTNCGARGKERTIKKIETNKNKDIFNSAIEKYYLTGKRNSLSTVYKLMIRDNFANDIKIKNGIKIQSISESVSIPTFRQFQYWFNKNQNIRETISKRKGLKNYESNNRPLLGDSTYEVFGPGSCYQIDATIVDIYLVSRYQRNWIIGRPTLYLVVDVFSRLITGFYVGLESPSWNAAMMALLNSSLNKVRVCSQFGIEITEDEWPSSHIPQIILADRGEFEGTAPEDGLIKGLQITIQNSSSYRGDMKGIVERLFRTVHDAMKPFVPGYTNKDFKKRGGKDYRLEASIDIFQFSKIIVKIILHHNSQLYLDNYIRDFSMIEDEVIPIPNMLWSWGIKNRGGILRQFSEEIIMLNLMPSDIASVTGRGIRFRGLLYSSEMALKEQWFHKAKNYGSWKIKVIYDSRNMDYIYFKKDNKSFEKCFLLEHQDRYKGMTFEEIQNLFVMEKTFKKEYKNIQYQSDLELIADIEAIVSEEKTHKELNSSKKERLNKIRRNRLFEKENIQKEEYFELAKKDYEVIEEDKSQVINIKTNSKIDLLKKIQKDSIKEVF